MAVNNILMLKKKFKKMMGNEHNLWGLVFHQMYHWYYEDKRGKLSYFVSLAIHVAADLWSLNRISVYFPVVIHIVSLCTYISMGDSVNAYFGDSFFCIFRLTLSCSASCAFNIRRLIFRPRHVLACSWVSSKFLCSIFQISSYQELGFLIGCFGFS